MGIMNKINLSQINLEEFIRILLIQILKKESIVIVGDFGSGKTTILNELSKKLKVKINSRAEITNLSFWNSWPKGKEVILVDEATRNLPKGKNSFKYDSAVIATHNKNDGKFFAKYLSNSKINFYQIY